MLCWELLGVSVLGWALIGIFAWEGFVLCCSGIFLLWYEFCHWHQLVIRFKLDRPKVKVINLSACPLSGGRTFGSGDASDGAFDGAVSSRPGTPTLLFESSTRKRKKQMQLLLADSLFPVKY